ncbi:triphosphoribosyl-dephospho-CoA synthase [uncultured Enterococcus sp.]|uniref:triphosphoribosyl-dephospho-CoA synthase n=1 Tax=uncultured Enterococcus sp. TaxID=167972 RepID=UPI0025DB09E7|nr:triphosphoribosyl-dephospho-CoA synthase [uncultured Enterococcus sp.]
MQTTLIKTETIASQLALFAEQALIKEVTLTPKPGLVDRQSTGVHTDMDYDLFIRSAKTLTPYFQEMALVGITEGISSRTRKQIAAIGRLAERAMLKATNGVNTHKGAIWSLGLLVTVSAYQLSEENKLDLTQLFMQVATLVQFPDDYTVNQVTHGEAVKQKYRVNGAYEEAAQGFPTLQKALHMAKEYPHDDSDYALRVLSYLISQVEDTCILYRSDQDTLRKIQTVAYQAASHAIPNVWFDRLTILCQQKRVSPGGSADLLAAFFFIESMDQE